MRPIQVHEIRNVNSRTPETSTRPTLFDFLELLLLPLLFLALYAGWPLALATPAPWWVLVGAVWYGGLAA